VESVCWVQSAARSMAKARSGPNGHSPTQLAESLGALLVPSVVRRGSGGLAHRQSCGFLRTWGSWLGGGGLRRPPRAGAQQDLRVRGGP
jgi:hypothetical protein